MTLRDSSRRRRGPSFADDSFRLEVADNVMADVCESPKCTKSTCGSPSTSSSHWHLDLLTPLDEIKQVLSPGGRKGAKERRQNLLQQEEDARWALMEEGQKLHWFCETCAFINDEVVRSECEACGTPASPNANRGRWEESTASGSSPLCMSYADPARASDWESSIDDNHSEAGSVTSVEHEQEARDDEENPDVDDEEDVIVSDEIREQSLDEPPHVGAAIEVHYGDGTWCRAVVVAVAGQWAKIIYADGQEDELDFNTHVARLPRLHHNRRNDLVETGEDDKSEDEEAEVSEDGASSGSDGEETSDSDDDGDSTESEAASENAEGSDNEETEDEDDAEGECVEDTEAEGEVDIVDGDADDEMDGARAKSDPLALEDADAELPRYAREETSNYTTECGDEEREADNTRKEAKQEIDESADPPKEESAAKMTFDDDVSTTASEWTCRMSEQCPQDRAKDISSLFS